MTSEPRSSPPPATPGPALAPARRADVERGHASDVAIALDAWPLPALVVDAESDVIGSQNAAATTLLGARAEHGSEIVDPRDRDAWRSALRAVAAAPARVRVASPAGPVPVEMHVTRLGADAFGRVLVVLAPAPAAAEGAEAERAVAAAEARWRGRAHELEAAREDEKRRLARELHDQLGADLSLLRVELARVVPKLSWARRPVRETVERLRDRTGELLETVRRISRELRPRVLDHVSEVGLASVLEHAASEVHRSAGFVVHLDAQLSDVDDASIDAPRAEAAYHVVREALNNVVRHSGATRAVVSARVDRAGPAGPTTPATPPAPTLVVEVLDDGRGATAAAGGASGEPEGIGWWSLSERVRAFGGDLSVRAVPGVGTTVSARIPLAGEAR